MTEAQILALLKKNRIAVGNIEIREGGIVVFGSVFINGFLSKLPVQFLEVTGDFCTNEYLSKTLEGCPKNVMGTFDARKTYNLPSLMGGPERVGGHYYCNGSFLPSLEGAPKYVAGQFQCHQNNLDASDHIPLLLSTIVGKITTDHSKIDEIVNSGRQFGKIDRGLIPEKINRLRDLDGTLWKK